MIIDAERIKTYISANFPQFGINKRRQLARLLYEIAKREQCDYQELLKEASQTRRDFPHLKRQLMRRRFPMLTENERNACDDLSELDINPDYQIRLKKKPLILPKRFFIETSVMDSDLVKRLQVRFPSIPQVPISTYKEFTAQTPWSIGDYNQRTDNFFLVRENFDFYKACPCAPQSLHCGYHVVNLGSGCAFECAYCYLQDYLNGPGIVVPANIENFFDQFAKYKQNIRVGSGELTDSLIFDHLTGYASMIVDFFKKYPGSTFEFKTKSNNIDGLLSVTPGENIVISWSLNPQTVIETTEFQTASLTERLEAARKCVAAGYKVAFHFDPIIYYVNWENDYRNLIQQTFAQIDQSCIAWLSLGTLRMTTRLKKIIENRFPQNTILDEEFLSGHDGKLRYSPRLRTEIYTKMKEWILSRAPQVYLYLCMEEKEVCGTCETAPLKSFVKEFQIMKKQSCKK